MAEDLTKYLAAAGIAVTYLHSDIDTVERLKIINDLRSGVFDVLVGINLLREGLDIPEVSLVAILDADKEGFLRNETSLIQTVGRAARNARGHVVMYADNVTDSMRRAIEETNRRREKQLAYNEAHHITPMSIKKEIREGIEASIVMEEAETYNKGKTAKKGAGALMKNPNDVITKLEEEMRRAAKELNFERAAMLRDRIQNIRNQLEE